MVSPSSSASLSIAETDEESLNASSSNPLSFSNQSMFSSALSLEKLTFLTGFQWSMILESFSSPRHLRVEATQEMAIWFMGECRIRVFPLRKPSHPCLILIRPTL